ncbi:hypothetical protein [Comamonas endophytica]|uniref:Uncharacterized protein n=1 Tax=Comamonas endophytica TaxID=2949090 RepID=A0ABY6G7X3_9BURK|nr:MULTISPECIES: hypothetical protein [unclassified Acidovorax]MCD2514569.1 hypothetical protein [Acidovorax sp. D4N7]UYG51146.1 hypothetical protein M9799_13770 [Acidovorax sp. 5MLIR]
MAYQVGNACYSTAQQAAHASASSQAGAVISRGQQTYVVNVVLVEEDTIHYRLEPIGAGVPLMAPIPYNAQPCNLLQAEDGLTIGWMIAAAWIGAYALLFIARVLRGETGENYGNS